MAFGVLPSNTGEEASVEPDAGPAIALDHFRPSGGECKCLFNFISKRRTVFLVATIFITLEFSIWCTSLLLCQKVSSASMWLYQRCKNNGTKDPN